MSITNVETTVYLTLEPEWSRYGTPPRVNGMKVTSMTKNRPKRAAGPVVELKLRLPAAAFEPLAPTVVIEVPPEALDFEPTITVEGLGDRTADHG